MTGWTWEYIDETMTLPRFYSLLDFWEVTPPLARSINEVRMMLRLYFGIKDKTPHKKKEMTEEEFKQALGAFSGAIGG